MNRSDQKGRARILVPIMILAAGYAAGADAQGFLDRLKGAAEQVIEKTKEQIAEGAGSGQASGQAPAQNSQPTTRPRSSASSSVRRNCGALGAGCADGMNDLVSCMDQGKAHYYGELLAPALQTKLDAGVLAAGSREDLEYDIRAVKAAGAPPYDKVAPADPARPHRYLDWLTPQEQADIMNESNRYSAALRKECNDKYAHF